MQTPTRAQPFDPQAQGFPDRWDNPREEVFWITEPLRPFYRRSPSLDRDRIERYRAKHGTGRFVLSEKLWSPGSYPPEIRADRDDQLAHALALRDAARDRDTAQRQAREKAWTEFHTCQICGLTDHSTAPRPGLPAPRPRPPGDGPRLCEPCAAFLVVLRRRWADEQTEQAAAETTPNGKRADLVTDWLAHALHRQED